MFDFKMPIILRRFILVICAGLMTAMLPACSSQELYTNLSEEHANEMVAVLMQADITAEKTTGKEGKWTIAVPQSDFAKAVDVLRARGLPHQQFETLGTVFQPGGITETPLAQRARLVFAKQQELERMIGEIDGVVSAPVQLAMPEPDALTQELKPASASILVKYRPGFDLRSKAGSIKSLVASAVEGLDAERVSVVLEPAQSIPVARAPDKGIDFGIMGRALAGLGAAILFFFAGRSILRTRRMKQREALTTDQPPS
jgi:type III secretion protein J